MKILFWTIVAVLYVAIGWITLTAIFGAPKGIMVVDFMGILAIFPMLVYSVYRCIHGC